jgi:hypothetical protein
LPCNASKTLQNAKCDTCASKSNWWYKLNTSNENAKVGLQGVAGNSLFLIKDVTIPSHVGICI